MAKAAKKAAKKSAAPKPPKAPKAAKAPKDDKPAARKKAFNLVDPETRALFLKDLEDYQKALAKLSTAQSAVRKIGKTIKADGFTMGQIKFAIQCQSPEGEREAKMIMANNLLAAAYAGADIGEQLSLFLDEPRVPAVDRAAKEGQADAMANKPAKPGYDPSTPQYKSYMDAYHDEQGRQLKAGIKPLDDAEKGGQRLITKADKEKAAAAKDAGPPSPPPEKPVLSKGLTHKEQSAADKAAKDAAKKTADQYFKPTTGDFGNA